MDPVGNGRRDKVVFNTKGFDLDGIRSTNDMGVTTPLVATGQASDKKKRGRPRSTSAMDTTRTQTASVAAAASNTAANASARKEVRDLFDRVDAAADAAHARKRDNDDDDNDDSELPPSKRQAVVGSLAEEPVAPRRRPAKASKKASAAEAALAEEANADAEKVEMLRLQMTVMGYYQLLGPKLARFGFTEMPSNLLRWDKKQLVDHIQKIRISTSLASNSDMVQTAVQAAVGVTEGLSVVAHKKWNTVPLIGLQAEFNSDPEMVDLVTEVVLEDLALYTVGPRWRLLGKLATHSYNVYARNKQIIEDAGLSTPAPAQKVLNRKVPRHHPPPQPPRHTSTKTTQSATATASTPVPTPEQPPPVTPAVRPVDQGFLQRSVQFWNADDEEEEEVTKAGDEGTKK